MKFSVLLPTRNRLEYLKYAVTSVVRQAYNEWEIIISDNASEQDIEGFVRSLGDDRIKYYRTENFCSVTENWNNALERSSGDYVVMLGDDDCLLDGYFSYCLTLLRKYDFPDMLYNSALNYVYPGVMPGAPEGYLMKFGYAPFLVREKAPCILDKKEIKNLTKEVLNFNVSFNFNMQHSLVSKKLIEKMQNYGKFYQSPYPDYYAMTALFLKADRILAVPDPLVVIGVTPKSFGFHYFNNQEEKGTKFLQGDCKNQGSLKASKYMLSGTEMNISWLLALDKIWQNFKNEHSLKVGYRKFRFLQMIHQCKKYACHENVNFSDMRSFVKQLFLWEKALFLCLWFFAFCIRKRPKSQRGRAWINRLAYYFSHPVIGESQQIQGQFRSVMDVFEIVKIK